MFSRQVGKCNLVLIGFVKRPIVSGYYGLLLFVLHTPIPRIMMNL